MRTSFYKLAAMIVIITTFTHLSFAQTNWTTTGNTGTTPGTNFVGTTDNKGLSIKTNAKEAIRIDNKQNVGVGTSSPSAALDIVPKSAAAFQIDPFGSAAGNTGELHMTELVVNGLQYVGFKAPDNIVSNLIWTLPAADGTNGQVLSTDGVGHLSWAKMANPTLSNLKSPTAVNLDLLPGLTNSVSLGNSSLRWKDVNLYNLKFADGTVQTTAFVPYVAGSGISISGNTLSSTNFSPWSSSGSSIYYNSGNVGIGTGSPGSPLTIASVSSTPSVIHATSTYTNNLDTIIRAVYNGPGGQSDVVAIGGYSHPDWNYGIGGSFSGAWTGAYCEGIARGDFAGSVGVEGFASVEEASSSAIGVYGYASYGEGNSYAVYGSSSDYAGFFDGEVYSNVGYYTSDERLKTNIQPVQNALDKIMALQPSTYTFKKSEYPSLNLPDGSQYGLIAQNVETVLPELVRNIKEPLILDEKTHQPTHEPVAFKAVNYNGVIPVIVKAMQEQQQTIIDLQQQIDDLKASIAQAKTGSSSSSLTDDESSILDQNSPNPFSKNTIIHFSLGKDDADGMLVIRDVSGAVIKAFSISNSDSQVVVDGGDLSVGTYFYSLLINGKTIDTKKMILTK